MKNFRNQFTVGSLMLILITAVVSVWSCSQAPLTIKVSDFGAVPNDGKDDVTAILKAFEACKKQKATTLIFDPGTYDIYGSQKNEAGNFLPSLNIDSISNLIIEGNWAEFVGHDYSSMFNFVHFHNITIKNLTTDWNPLPYTQGKVLNVENDFMDLEVVAPFEAKAGLRTEGFLGYDMEKRRMARRFTDHYQKGYEKLSEVIQPGVMRLYIGRQDRFSGTMPLVGMYVIARHQIYNYQSFQFSECEKVQMENVTIYSNPGMGVTGKDCRDITIHHLKVMLRPGSGRWMSTTADATNFEGCRGTILMENCFFEAQGDDATNVRSGEYTLVDERLGDTKLRIKKAFQYGGNIIPPEIGDKLELSSTEKMLLPYATVTVKSLEMDVKNNSYVVELSDKLPDMTKKGDVVGNASSCPVLRIRNCTAIRNRARGFIVKTRDVIIEDCTFQDITATAVGLEADVNAWWESIGSRDVIIRNNRFIDCKFEPEYLKGVIESHTMSEVAPAGVHQRILIENNVFLGSDAHIMKIGSADGVQIINNLIDGPKEEAILLYNTKNVLLKGNKLTNCKVGLKIGPGCEAATIKTENNIGL